MIECEYSRIATINCFVYFFALMAKMGKLSLKLVVDKEKNRVVFAESDKDFVDILFSLLTLPLGTIIRRTGKKSAPLGCLNTMYKSIENLGKYCFETEACKNMLLEPRSASEEHCEGLKIKVDDLNPRRFHVCLNCLTDRYNPSQVYSLVPGARCNSCRNTMSNVLEKPRKAYVENSRDGVFANGGAKLFMVSDDLRVMAASTANTLALLKELGITDCTILEERDVEVGQNEILSLLERFLLSKTPISEVFLGLKQVNDVKIPKVQEQSEDAENDTNNDSNSIDLKLVLNKKNGEVLYAEATGDFINILFSFLTFPLGSVLKLLDSRSSLECADNLYCSVNDQSAKSEKCRAMLLTPKIATFFGVSKQMMKIDENPPETATYSYYSVNPINPKLPNFGTNNGGGFVNEQERFMVTGDLVVKPMSAAALIKLTKTQHVPTTSIEERIIKFGEAEALKLLKASLVSHNAFSSAFSLLSKEKGQKYYA